MAAIGSVADVQRELLDSVQKIVRLPPEINDDSVPAFNQLRRAVLHVSGVHQDSLANVLGELDAKAEVLRFLVAVHAAKRIYRKQVAAVLTILLQSGAWKEALEGHEAIWSSLPSDLRAIAAPQEQAISTTSSAHHPAAADAAVEAPVAGPAAAAESAPQGALDEGRAPGPSSSLEPSAASSSPSPPKQRRPPAGSAEAPAPAPAPRERLLQPQELRALRTELEAAVRPLGTLQPHHDHGELFGALRRAVQKASTAPRAQLRELCGDVEPKRATLIFLSELHDQSRKHRKQIEGTLEVLLKVGNWLREARALTPPSASPSLEGGGGGGPTTEGGGLSAELCRLVESRQDDLVDDEVADASASFPLASAPGAASTAPAAAKAIASIPADFLVPPAWCIGQRRGSHASDSPYVSGSASPSRSPRARAATHSAWSPPSGISDSDVREAVEAARLRMERHSMAATCSSPSSSSPWPQAGLKASSQEVLRAHSQLCALVSRHQEPADAAQSDDATVAFEDFRRSLARSLGSSEVEEACVATVGDLTPKEPVLRFLLALSRAKPRYQSRIVGTLTSLMGCPSWKAAGDADLHLRAGIGAILDGQTDLIKLGDGTATSLKRKAADAIAGGGVGAIMARVCAGFDLVNPRHTALPDPYVRVCLGGKSKHTAVQLAALHPQWQAPPFIFEVPSHDAELRFQVLDRRDGGAPGAGVGGDCRDAQLGHLAFWASSVPQGQQRHRLHSVEHGELEVELRYEGEEKQKPELEWVADTNDAQEFTVESMLEQAIAMLRGCANTGEPVEIFDSELRCPSRHPIVKRKEGLRWHQVLTTAEHRCNLCNDVIPNTTSRWRCRYHCDFDVCEACHAEVYGGLPNLSRTKSREYASKSPLAGSAGIGAGRPSFGDAGDGAAAASSSSSLGVTRPAGSAAGRRQSSSSAMTRIFASTAAPRHGGAAGASGSAMNGRGSRLRCSSASRIAQRVKSTATSAVTRTGLLPSHADSYTPLEGESSDLDVQTVILPTDALEFRQEDSAVFYGVDVVPEQSSADPWRVMRRYNDFSNLADRLGPHAKCFPEAPFPGKALFALTEEQVEERRADLEAWLRRVLARKPMPRAWTRPLYDFCHAGASHGGAKELGGFTPLPRGPSAGLSGR